MEGLNLLTDGFVAYGDRHLQRWDHICQQTFMVDLLLQGTAQTLPQAAADTAKVLFENGDLSPREKVIVPTPTCVFIAAETTTKSSPVEEEKRQEGTCTEAETTA